MTPKLRTTLPYVHAELTKALLTIPGISVRDRVVTVPHHAVPLADKLIRLVGITGQNTHWTVPLQAVRTWEAIEADLLARGEFKPHFLGDYPLPHQREGVSWACSRHGALLHHPTGSGKTYEAIAIICETDPAIKAIVITRASTVVQFCRQVAKYTNLHAYALRSAGHARKKDRWQSLDEYLAWCEEKGQRAIVVCGYENISTFKTPLLQLYPYSLIVDESHLLKSWKRWVITPLPHPGPPPPDMGKYAKEISDPGPKPIRLRNAPHLQQEYTPAEEAAYQECLAVWESQKEAWDWTKQRDDYRALVSEGTKRGAFVKEDEATGDFKLIEAADNRTTSALVLAKGSVRTVLTTATPIRDRVRDLYAQLTLCEPDGWGNWTAWSNRYCDARPSSYNAMARDTSGVSNANELVARIQTVINTVQAAEVRKNLPGLRRETLYVEQSQMCALTEAERKRFANEAKKALKKGKNAMVEVEMAESAARCRKALLDTVESHVDSGQKVVVFVTRKWIAYALRGHVAGRIRKRGKVWVGTGKDSQNARQIMFDEFIEHEGAGVFIGTGDAWGTSKDGFQCAHAAIFLGWPFAPGDLDQWEGRFPRLGQSEPITLYYVVGEGTVLEHYANLVIDKLPAIAKIASSGALEGVEHALGGTMDSDGIASSILSKITKYKDTDFAEQADK